MPTLAKLLDCLKWPKVSASGRPVGPNPQVQVVADPELAFGWQGNLYNNGIFLAGLVANSVMASVTIPDDCFYVLDATANVGGSTNGMFRLALEIVDPSGNIAYQNAFGFATSVATAVGISNTPPAEIYNMRLHLLQNVIIRWRNLDALNAAQPASASLALRKLYEENI